MTAGPNDNTPYTAQDIERYHAGQLSAQEMHALEKAALDDPFLADALEGYKFTQTPGADVAALKELLAEKTDQDKVVPLAPPRKRPYPLLRIAALFLLLLGAGWSVYYLMDSKRDKLALDSKQNSQPATTTAPVPEAGTDTSAAIQAAPQNEITFAQPAPLNPAANAPAAKQAERETADQAYAAPLTAPPAAAMAPPVASVAVADSQRPMLLKDEPLRDVAAAERKQSVPSNAIDGRARGVELRQAPSYNAIQGRVVDQNNRGVPHASVAIRGTNTGTTTDDKGNFSLKATDTAVNATIAAVGYETQNVTLSNQRPETNIVLNESTQNLQEVVVTGVSTKRKRSAVPTAAATSLSEPREGWEPFQNYIAKNRKSAQQLGAAETPGTVILTFTVNRHGTPTNIKVEQSLTTLHDAEAIRLLREGPRWDRKKGARGKVTISFP